jgi:nitrogen-specific signal transduction histidine kinase
MVKAHSEVGHAIIEITDNGPGLPERLRDELFQLFARSSRAGGLWARSIDRPRLDAGPWGDISSACSAYEGTVFRLSLPIEPNQGERPTSTLVHG